MVKVGGSLLGWKPLPERLRRYLDGLKNDRVVLVAGGGLAADFVRALDLEYGIGENQAHRLALKALDFTAEVLAELVTGLEVVDRPANLDRVWEADSIPVLAPSWFVLKADRASPEPLAESWRVTSDSIAARLAVFLGSSDLRLLKSMDASKGWTRNQAAEAGLVDSAFPDVAATIGRISIVNLRGDPPLTRELT